MFQDFTIFPHIHQSTIFNKKVVQEALVLFIPYVGNANAGSKYGYIF